MINFILFLFLNFFHGNFLNDRFLLPTSVLIIASLSALFMLVFYRLLVKELFVYIKNGVTEREMRHAAIFGAGEAGIIAQEAIKRDSKSLVNVVAFLDDDSKKEGKNIDGKRIYKGLEDLEKLVKQFAITELIIAVRDLSVQRKNEIIRHSSMISFFRCTDRSLTAMISSVIANCLTSFSRSSKPL
ncbi:MAG: nucleoside-diphosphate sugar epimerase/dehydratase [Algoriphagus aquaeductus]|uniref:nucleoside-diphosphate sugar epimerase/dehydratase n=1 Tax=Algoriphagus aquaeductus TaxID=475299 RepID=UPI0038794281